MSCVILSISTGFSWLFSRLLLSFFADDDHKFKFTKMWMILCIMVTLNSLEFCSINIEQYILQPHLLLISLGTWELDFLNVDYTPVFYTLLLAGKTDEGHTGGERRTVPCWDGLRLKGRIWCYHFSWNQVKTLIEGPILLLREWSLKPYGGDDLATPKGMECQGWHCPRVLETEGGTMIGIQMVKSWCSVQYVV